MSRQAKSLDVYLAEVNTAAPNRSKISDGGLGDEAHSSRLSDHNPNSAGVWRARDVTNDPDGGMPGQRLSRLVAAKLGKIPALGSGAYVIFNHQIISTNRLAEGWRPYTGINAHEHHVHVSVATAASGYDNTRPWNLFAPAKPEEPHMNHVEKAHAHFAIAARELRRGLTELDQVKPDREVVKGVQVDLREARDIIAGGRKRLPKK